jgi:hypothetical protein
MAGHDTADETVFVWSWPRFLLAATVAGMVAATVGWLGGTWLYSLAAGRPWPAPVEEAVAVIAVNAVAFPLFSFLLARGLPSHLALRRTGIEMAAARCDGVLIPYSAMSGARVRWFWPASVLEVSLDAAAQPSVTPLRRGGSRPAPRRTAGQIRFRVPLAGLQVAKKDITATLRELPITARSD